MQIRTRMAKDQRHWTKTQTVSVEVQALLVHSLFASAENASAYRFIWSSSRSIRSHGCLAEVRAQADGVDEVRGRPEDLLWRSLLNTRTSRATMPLGDHGVAVGGEVDGIVLGSAVKPTALQPRTRLSSVLCSGAINGRSLPSSIRCSQRSCQSENMANSSMSSCWFGRAGHGESSENG